MKKDEGFMSTPKDIIVKVKKNNGDDDGIIRRIPRTSVEDRMFVRIIGILRVIEESVRNDCSGNYFLFKSVMKNSVVGVSGEDLY